MKKIYWAAKKIAEITPDFDIIPISALERENLGHLETFIIDRLPVAVPQFPDDQLTDKPMRFIVAEIIREKLFRVQQRSAERGHVTRFEKINPRTSSCYRVVHSSE